MPPHPNLTRTGHESLGEIPRLPQGEKGLFVSSYFLSPPREREYPENSSNDEVKFTGSIINKLTLMS